MDKKLRLYAAGIIVESKLSKAAKLQLLNFIQTEATDAQIKALILDGKIVKLDEQAEEIVNDRFSILEQDPVQMVKPLLQLTGLALGAWAGAMAPFVAAKVYKRYMSKAGRACAGVSGEDRNKCISKFKTKAKIEALKAAASKCPQSKNPEKCKEKMNKKISALQATL
jgi:hypothetical protein